jgi:Protein of unknown function (DUF2971)
MTVNPQSLFKYTGFGERLLDLLCRGSVYYADPAAFNDPLDCQPVVVPDVSTVRLKQILAQLVFRRLEKEFDVAMKKLGLRIKNTLERRRALTESEVEQIVGEIEYQATGAEDEHPEAYIQRALASAIETELRQSYNMGVLCLSTRCDSVLMWSHYAQQHGGVCVEYGVASLPAGSVFEVKYGESREVPASQLASWLVDGDSAAESQVRRACLLTKSAEWEYEGEWRMLGRLGPGLWAPKVKSVIFGMRCPISVQYTIVAALRPDDTGIQYWEMGWPVSRFELRRREVNVDELLQTRHSTSSPDDFPILAQDESSGATDNANAKQGTPTEPTTQGSD